MPVLLWDERFSVGIDEVDEQHKELIAIINELVDGMQRFMDSESLLAILPRLASYTDYHFGAEEELMRRAGYPELDGHMVEHAEFKAILADFESKYRDGSVTLSMEVLDYLTGWLRSHILDSDRRYAAYIESNS